jgi:hypothetical protein
MSRVVLDDAEWRSLLAELVHVVVRGVRLHEEHGTPRPRSLRREQRQTLVPRRQLRPPLVRCPVCSAPTAIASSVGRCLRCTVIVRVRGGQVTAGGWRGGDARAAGRALQEIERRRAARAARRAEARRVTRFPRRRPTLKAAA